MMSKSTQQQVILCFLSLLAGGATQGAEIQFKSQAEVRGSLVLLGDVAQIQDPDARQVATLSRIELFPAPARGRMKAVRDVEIRQLLQLHGVRISDHRFVGAETVRIGHSKVAIQAQSASSSVPSTTEQKQVVVAKKPIASGTIIRAVDVELKVPDTLGPIAGAASNPELIVGHESSRSYNAGQVIDSRTLRKPILVRRGDAVTVVAKAAGVRVRTTAKALSDGTFGDLLPVESPEREKYSAIVTGSREVEVFASGTNVVDPNPVRPNTPREPNHFWTTDSN